MTLPDFDAECSTVESRGRIAHGTGEVCLGNLHSRGGWSLDVYRLSEA